MRSPLRPSPPAAGAPAEPATSTPAPALPALALLAALAGCGAPTPVPPPKASVALPSGAALKPFSAGDPTRAAPQMMAAAPDGTAFVSLTNLDASYAPGGPGLLVRLTPSTGAQVVIDLGGADGHGCTNAGVVRFDAGMLLAACTGTFDLPGSPSDPRGRALAQVDAASNALARTVAAPAGVQPSAVAVGPQKIWVGDFAGARLFSVDRTSFALVDGADAAHPMLALPCTAGYTYVADLLVLGGELWALCAASDGYLVRLDAQTGAAKGSPLFVGAQPVAMALTGEGHIAVANSLSGTVSLVNPASPPTVQRDLYQLGRSAALQDVRARGYFLYTVASGTNTVQKIDLTVADPTKGVVAEVFVGDNAFPWSILPLDDDQAIVSNSVPGTIAGVKFTPAK